ncbi:hypothetical protein Pstr01_33980 [Pseudomonas straminea]|uniref:Uncharacterized protein n=1 Tax=Pseudomonas straminea TaxID=47882 RepID=A0A1I1X9H1_PSEOC|nr:hypothetical protein Pstr01_33980 [Pseudomonas straminea]SFE02010.1 hypothetical protein SAMN05216372_10719 [Pseudomonas straminea]
MDYSHVALHRKTASVHRLTARYPLLCGFCWRAIVLATLVLGLSGCMHNQANGPFSSNSIAASPGELFQTHSDRMATIGMRNNLNSLYRLMDKLYQRNPREWQKTGLASRQAAVLAVRQSIEKGRPPPALAGRQDIAALSYALGPEFEGDRVGAFIYAIGSMVVTAHGGRTEFYITDTIDAQFVHNAARNIEKATWLLGTRRDVQGNPLLLSNELSENGRNLSFAVEFGKIVARLDYLSDVLDERYRRIGVNYAHSLLFLNFLPVQ